MGTHRYDLFGLTVASEFAIPWAPEAAEPGVGDVVIRRGSGEGGFHFDVAAVGRYRIIDGREILVDAKPGVGEETIRLYLLGSALGVLLHQRGLLVLHANAIVIDGAAALFMGPSGAGKSTLAAWFAARGYKVLSDDICAVEVRADGGVFVLPGLTRLRLAEDAARHLGIDPAEGEWCAASGKREIGLPRRDKAKAVGLRACYLLSEGTAEQSSWLRQVAGMNAAQMLIANTYRGIALHELGASARHLKACAQVAASVPCYQVSRAKDWAHFDTVAQTLLTHPSSQ